MTIIKKADQYQREVSRKKSNRLLSKFNLGLAFIIVATASTSSQANYYACKIPKSYYKHVSCTSNSRYFLAVKDSGSPVAIIGKDGRRVIDLMRYTKVDASKLRNGVLPVQRGGRVGYVNMSGREVVPTIYDIIRGDKLTSGWARAANDNRIVVKKSGKFGIISTNNQIILPFATRYKTISDYKSGVAQVIKSHEIIRVDTNARRIAAPNAPATKPLSPTDNNPTSNTHSPPPNTPAITNEIWQPKERDGKWGFVNSADVPMITFSFEAVMPFSEGLAAVKMNDNWGFVNLAGSLVIPFRFDESGIIRGNSSDKAQDSTKNKPQNNTQGNNDTYLGVPPLTFKDGKAWVGNLNNGTKLCIDKQGINVPCDGAIVVSTVNPIPLTNEGTIPTSVANSKVAVSAENSALGNINQTTQGSVETVLPVANPLLLPNSNVTDDTEMTTKPKLELRKIIKPKAYTTPTP